MTVNEALRAKLLGFSDFETVELSIPEWQGICVYVRGITAAERDRWEEGFAGYRLNGTLRASLAVLACYDADGQRIFTDADVVALAQKNASALDRIWTVASRLAGLSKRESEEIEGN